MKHECKQYIESINAWKAHLLRTVNQEEAKQDALAALDAHSCFIDKCVHRYLNTAIDRYGSTRTPPSSNNTSQGKQYFYKLFYLGRISTVAQSKKRRLVNRYCSTDCFEILDSAPTKFQLKLKEARHINWEKPNLNQQVHHVNLTLTL